MINELAWRKFPRDTMRNEDLDYVSYLLGKDKAALPFLFYTTAFCKCDDDGVFDIEDGVIFSRLMRLGNPEDVITVAELLCDRKIITRIIDGENVFMITDWEAPQRPGSYGKKSMTAEERRRAIAAKISSEQSQRKTNMTNFDQKKSIPIVSYEQIKAPDNFFCPEFDKNAKNVETQRERDREIRDIETHTQRVESEQTDRDTEEIRQRSNSLAGPIMGPAATIADKNQEESEELTCENQSEEGLMLAEAALSGSDGIAESNSVNDEINKARMYRQMSSVKQLFSDFFAKNCIGYKPNGHDSELNRLAERMCELSSDKNPPEIIASVFCSQFQVLREKSDYYATVPLTSTNLLKPNTYAAVCTAVSKVLNTKGASDQWQIQMDQQRLEAEADRPLVYDKIKNDCLKYGIDPNQEGAWAAALRAQKAQGIK